MADSATPSAHRGTGIAFHDVVKAYGANTVLHGIHLDISPGELIALLGPSGCGKTTMLRCLAGLETLTSGRIEVGGADVSQKPANTRDMGVVFQQYSLFPHMTVRQNVEFGLRMRRVPAVERASRSNEALELVGLGEYRDRYAHTLSGGQQQRVALARALVTRPRALLLDEPLSALDAKVRVRLRDEIRAIQTELGITTIFVTHDQEEALAIADRVAVMREGVIDQLGAPEELYRSPATPFVARFIGESNRLGCELRQETALFNGIPLPVVGSVSLLDGAAITAYVRPEHLALTPLDAPSLVSHPIAGPTGVVVSSGFLGSQRRTLVRLESGAVVTVQHATHAQFSAEDVVRLHFSGDPVAVEAA